MLRTLTSFNSLCAPRCARRVLLIAAIVCGASNCFAINLNIVWTNEGATNLTAAEKLVANQVISSYSSLFQVPVARTYNVTITNENLGANTVGSNSGFVEDTLGNPIGSVIKLNTNAAVAPFYIDPTPATNDDYTLMGGIYKADAGTPPDGKWDLLTLINHELGHALGFGGAGGFWNRFLSRLGDAGDLTYLGENGFTFVTTDQDHTASNTHLLGDPGFQRSQRQYFGQTPELDALFDCIDYGLDKRIFDKAGASNPIADNATTTFTLDITEHGAIKDLDIALYIKSPNDGDLEMSLKGPDGTTALLVKNRGDAGDDFGTAALWTRFDDEGRLFPVESSIAPFRGTQKPEGALSVFDGKDIFGTWTLEIKDTIATNASTFEGFSIIATVPEPGALLLAIGALGIARAAGARRRT
jgi:subtilisin-like proprotein convertase family protein